MRWRRGFLRAWIVVSAIWIGLSVYIQGPVIYRLPWLFGGAVRIPQATETGLYAEWDLSKSPAQLSDDVTQFLRLDAERLKTVDRKEADEKLQSLSEDRDALLVAITREYEQEKKEAWTAWLFSITPPIAMLAIGFVMAWVLRGFRPAT